MVVQQVWTLGIRPCSYEQPLTPQAINQHWIFPKTLLGKQSLVARDTSLANNTKMDECRISQTCFIAFFLWIYSKKNKVT